MYPKLIIGSKGVIKLKSPFSDLLAKREGIDLEYRVSAINTIDALEMSGFNVFNFIYKDNGLGEDTYQKAKQNGIPIITLTSVGKPTLQVPQDYVTSMPVCDGIPYYEPVLHASLGLIPRELDVHFLKQQVSSVITDTVGVSEEVIDVQISELPVEGVVGLEEHERLETIRISNVKNRTTDRALHLKLQDENVELKKEIVRLQTILIKHNLLGSG